MITINHSDRDVLLTKRNNIIDWKTKIADISQMTFSELEGYIDTNVKDLASAKVYLKKLSKATLALMKLLEEKIK